MASSSSVSHNHHMGELLLFDSFIYDTLGLIPISGSFIDVDDIDFIGYLALGLKPTLYPLYASTHISKALTCYLFWTQCRLTLHDNLRTQISLYGYVSTSIVHFLAFETEQSKEVPVYVNSLQPAIEQLNFPAKSTKMAPDNRFYVVYDLVNSVNSTTVVHIARHPTGYHPWSDFTNLGSMYDLCNSGSPAILPSSSTLSSEVTQTSTSNEAEFVTGAHHDQHVTSGAATSTQAALSSSSTIYSWVTYSASMMDNASTGARTSQVGPKSSRTARRKGKAAKKDKVKSEGGLKRVIKDADNWKKALAYLRALLRVTVCLGHIENPFLLNSQRRARAIEDVWPQALSRANISASELEDVKSSISKDKMTTENVLTLANPLLSEFIYDIKCLAFSSIGHSHGGFGLDDVAAGVLLVEMVHDLLKQFIRPKSHLLPIRDNGFAWFLCQQITKEIMWHIVFRPSTTHGAPLVLADLNPADFKDVNHPPYATMSLLGSSCYSALLQKYSILTNVPVDLLVQYPTPATVYEQLCETAAILSCGAQRRGSPGAHS
ncbi:hypothetical protein EDD22DRAFT_959838 [Suillus occidentalis]|nr:hypothetical protein EDD22DRAFT_959838 [Suillus occidentalis]